MATKAVDATQLDGDLTSVANAVRQKGGTSAALSFPAGFVSAVQAIPTGITPAGTKNITANGNYDVTNFASASVNVQGGGVPLPSGITAGDTPVAIGFVTNPNNDFIYSTTAKKIPGEEITIKRAGTYRFKATAQCETTTGTYALYIYKNNSLVHTETKASGLDAFSMSADIACNVGDIIDLRARSRGTSYFLWCPCFVACIDWNNGF